MKISEIRGKCKLFLSRIPRDVLIIGAILLAASLGFGSGYLAGREAGQGIGVTFEPLPFASPAAAVEVPEASVGRIVASKNGTKYYLPECSGAKRISEANKVWFTSVAAARAQGYTAAANCDGI